MVKRILGLIMAAVLTIGMSQTSVLAEDFKGSDKWTVEFNGSKMSSNFKSSELAEEVYQILPGDTIQLQVSVKNSGSKPTDWYMSNKMLKSLEESQSTADGGAYTYILTYKDSANKETTLYSSETAGGEGSDVSKIINSMSNYFYLDRLESGQKGTVYLTVGLDGETQGNGYQDTLAKLQMSFAAEELASISTNTSGRHTTGDEASSSVSSLPKTGDETEIMPWCAAALASGILLLIFGLLAFKREREEAEA